MAKKAELKKVENLGHGVGRRKTAVARVYLREGNGKITVNGVDCDKYFANELSVYTLKQPMTLTETTDKFDVVVRVVGGGLKGQAGACCLGIARALCMADDEAYHVALHNAGLLTRDSRMVERKKFGQKGARRHFQFSKR